MALTKEQVKVLSICTQLGEHFANDLVGWVDDAIDFRGLKHTGLTQQQVKISHAFDDKNFVCVSAGGGIGKSAFAAISCIHHLCTHPYAKIPTTAPSGKLLDDILWSEIAFWLKRCKYQEVFNPTKGKLAIKGFPEWYAVARTVPKDGKNLNDTLAGFHSPYLYILVDEASGVPNAVFTALDGAMTEENSKILLISNPVSTGGYFYDTISDPLGKGQFYKVLYFDSRESPLVDANYEQQIIARYGKDSAMYKAKVLGLPLSELDTILITPEDYDRLIATQRDRHVGRVILGCDVSEGGGNDSSVFCHREGNSIIRWDETQNHDAGYLVEHILKVHRDLYAKKYFTAVVDAVGYGAAVFQNLIRVAPFPVIGFVGSEKAHNVNMFDIKRAEGYHKLKEDFPLLHFPVPPPERLKKEAVNVKFDFGKEKGIISMEEKKRLRIRLGHSPDYIDALMLTCAVDAFTSAIAYHVPVSKGANIYRMLVQQKGAHISTSRYGKFIT
jgi:hypothetical protein